MNRKLRSPEPGQRLIFCKHTSFLMNTQIPKHLTNGKLAAWQATAAASPESTVLQLTPARAWIILLAVFFAVHVAALFTPSLLDDADAAHAQVARNIAVTGDWVTFKIDGVRYLEKAPLPYWLVAVDYHLFGYNTFATHLPMALGILGCATLAWLWARRAYGDRAALYSALAMLTSIGVFLFTRVYIPEALLTFFIALALYCLITGLEDRKPSRIYWMWASLALGVLTKGLIAPVFFTGAVVPYLLLTGKWRRWRELRPFSGFLLFFAIAAPWHILAGLRNPDQGHPIGNIPSPGNVHGFFYFYFLNEHVFRFLGTRYPHDYYKLPGYLYWSLHLIWLAPFSIFLPVYVLRAWQTRDQWLNDLKHDAGTTVDFYIEKAHLVDPARHVAGVKFRNRTTWLLALYAAVILIFFSISTNQEYYTFPAYFPIVVLAGGTLARAEEYPGTPRAWLLRCHAIFACIGIAAAAALAYGLWSARNLPFVADIGTVLAKREVAGYSVSMAHFFDLTGPSFAALREPAWIALLTLLVGPLLALLLRRRGHDLEATTSVAFTAALFLVAAHIALVRFEPMLSSRAIADTINHLAGATDRLLLYGDQSDGSSVIFYTDRQALLVEGQSSTLLWGSYYPDAPHIFLSDADLQSMWGKGPRNFLFVPGDHREHVRSLLGSSAIEVQRLADKTLYTDRPLGN
jgi:4-amino-4-deoxy-L-arabinose transferase-like glycosyltransferase